MATTTRVLPDNTPSTPSVASWLTSTYGWSQGPVTVAARIRGGAQGLRPLDLMMVVTALAGFATIQTLGWLTIVTNHLPGGAWPLTALVTIALVTLVVVSGRSTRPVRGRIGPGELMAAAIPVVLCQMLGMGTLLTPLLPSVITEVVPALYVADATVIAIVLWVFARRD
jgi:hypothetical protein